MNDRDENAPLEAETGVACPSCGVIYDPLTSEHICEVPVVPPKVEGVGNLQETAEWPDEPRMVACPFCQKPLDVAVFDPLQWIECCHCRQSFQLLEQFDEGQLTMAYQAGWDHAVYLGENLHGPGRFLVVVLSAHILAQPDARQVFIRKAGEMAALCDPAQVRFTMIQSHHGFLHLLVALQEDVTPEQVLQSMGIPLEGMVSEDASALTPIKYCHCPNCQLLIDAMDFDPLDEIRCPHCEYAFQIMRQLGSYRIDYKLNVGGTSKLYLAQDTNSKRQVALKVLSSAEMKRDPNSPTSLMREFELTSKLVHPNIIHAYEGGEFQGFYFISMELVDGLTLNQIMELIQMSAPGAQDPATVEMLTNKERYRQGLPELICIEVALQSTAGLGVAHQNGLVHGDIKPENIMVTYEGVVKVLDFGLVKFADTEELWREANNEDVSIMGTPFYIPPERVRGEKEDFRSDYYSLGATLYHLIRGLAPYRAKSPEEIAVMHAMSPLIKFRAFVPWISDTTARVIEKSMSKYVTDRYNSHLELMADLTLSKNQMQQSLKGKQQDGTHLLRTFMKSLPVHRKHFGVWQKAATVAVHTYKYTTMAITNRIRGILRQKK